MHTTTRIRPARLLARGAALRCPNCGGRGLLESWLRVRPACPSCGLRTDRGETDYWLGAYTVNLAVAELLAAGLLLAVLVLSWPAVPWNFLLYGGVTLMIASPIAFYPVSKTLWLATDLIFRPLTATDFVPFADGYAGARRRP